MVSELDPSSTDALAAAEERITWLEGRLREAEADAADRIGRLERQLQQARIALPTARDAGAVAANLAAQQQVDALRAALHEKERVAETLNQTIRELEDKLEDHYRETDRLLLKLSRYERQRVEAEERADRAERRVVRAEARAQALADAAAGSAPATGERPPADAATKAQSPAPPLHPPTREHLRRAAAARQGNRPRGLWIVLAVLLGLLLGLGGAVGLWWFGLHGSAPPRIGAWPPAPVSAPALLVRIGLARG